MSAPHNDDNSGHWQNESYVSEFGCDLDSFLEHLLEEESGNGNSDNGDEATSEVRSNSEPARGPVPEQNILILDVDNPDHEDEVDVKNPRTRTLVEDELSTKRGANSDHGENDINSKNNFQVESRQYDIKSDNSGEDLGAEVDDGLNSTKSSTSICSKITEETVKQEGTPTCPFPDANTGETVVINQLSNTPKDMNCNGGSIAFGEQESAVVPIGSEIIPAQSQPPPPPVYKLPEQNREAMEKIYEDLEKSEILDNMSHSNISWLAGDDNPSGKAHLIITTYGKKAFDAVFTPEEILRGRAGGGASGRKKNAEVDKYDLNKICVISRFLGWLISKPEFFTFAEFKDYANTLARECKNGLSEEQRQYFKDNVLFRYACDRRNILQGKPKTPKKGKPTTQGTGTESDDMDLNNQGQVKEKKSVKRSSQGNNAAEEALPSDKRKKT